MSEIYLEDFSDSDDNNDDRTKAPTTRYFNYFIIYLFIIQSISIPKNASHKSIKAKGATICVFFNFSMLLACLKLVAVDFRSLIFHIESLLLIAALEIQGPDPIEITSSLYRQLSMNFSCFESFKHLNQVVSHVSALRNL